MFFYLGSSIDSSALQYLEVGGAIREGSTINAHIVHVDNFGNLITSIRLHAVPELFTVPQVKIVFIHSGTTVDKIRQFFAQGPENGQAFIFGDSSGYVGIAVRNGNAAKTLGEGLGAPIALIFSEG